MLPPGEVWMEKVTVFLRTALFSFGEAEGHIPHGVHAVRGTLVERSEASLVLQGETLFDYDGEQLEGTAVRLELPWSKVDHVLWGSD